MVQEHLVEQFEKCFEMNYQNKWKDNPNLQWGQEEVWAIYRRNLPKDLSKWKSQQEAWYEMDYDDYDGTTGLARWGIDLDGILTKIMKGARITDEDPIRIQNAMKLTLLALSAGRAGEATLANMQRWRMDLFYQCMITNWNSSKTLSETACPFVYPLEFVAWDFYTQFAMFATVGKGLQRTRAQEEKGTVDYVFPGRLRSGSHHTPASAQCRDSSCLP